MLYSPTSRSDLATVVALMRELSRQTDPQEAANLYGAGLRRLNLVPSDRYLSLSRRNLEWPQFRITRCTTWKSHPDPWREREKLPLLSGGMLGDILYSNEPAIIEDIPTRLSADDPAHEYLRDMKLLVALPHYDGGESINAGILLNRSADAFPMDGVPMMLWQANLWGRATLNLVTQQKLQRAYESLDRELQVVGEIQKSLLPRALPEIPGIDIAAHYQTSQRAGGDYYDFFPLPGNQWGIFVADVSGHGTPAAVMMAVTHAIAHSRPGHAMPPGEVLAYLNNQLANLYTRDTGTFITALYAVLNPDAKTLAYASAGHPPPRLIHNAAPVLIPTESGFPLGIVPGESYAEHTILIQPGDKLLLYTDGIPESFSPLGTGELFGLPRLDAVACQPASTAQALIQKTLAAIGAFTQHAALSDDRTLLALLCN
jgi:sigma-B regulation protein RsbU (phosphoserine phosphatase)